MDVRQESRLRLNLPGALKTTWFKAVAEETQKNLTPKKNEAINKKAKWRVRQGNVQKD